MNAPLPAKWPSSDVADGEALPIIADHVLFRKIGNGAYGDVWLAKNNVIGGFHAVKVIYRKKFASERDYQCEFEGIRKFDPISRSHPGLVTILHVGRNEQAGYFYYVMELADDARSGQTIDTDTYVPRTLKEEMANDPHRPLNTSVQIALSLTSALGFLHAQGLIHRDIKPTNIIFVNGVPKIADVGLITEAGEDVSGRGTIHYMPSEGPGEPTADIFGLGKVFYELFMGLHPKHFPELPDAAEEFTTVPELLQVNKLILKACHHNPRQRFQTTTELHKALRAVATAVQEKQPGTGTTETTGRSASAKPDLKPGSKTALPEGRPITGSEEPPKARWPRMAALLVLLLAIGGAVFLARNPPKDTAVVNPPPTNPPPAQTTSPSVIPAATNPVVVLMDTTAPDGTYDDDNKKIGASNAKEVSIALEAESVAVTSHPEPLYAGWDNETDVISMNPDLVIVHRSSFHHSYNAVFDFGRTNNGFAHPTEDPKWLFLYNQVGDDKLITLMGCIGNEVSRTKFLVYSRGTDTNWLSADFRIRWVRKIEERFPKLKGRVSTMVIPNGYKGSFRQPETRKLLRTNVVEILNLPKKGEPEKRK